MVEWYTSRKLAFTTDRLNALAGILSRLQHTCQQRFLWGHPICRLFDLSFLWIASDLEPIKKVNGDSVKLVYQLPSRDGCYPSWSWAGWPGHISYALADDLYRTDLSTDIDESVRITVRPALDERLARTDPAFSRLSAQLLRRVCNRGIVDIESLAISAASFSCHLVSGAQQVGTLDGQTGCWIMRYGLLSGTQSPAHTLREEGLHAPPCGVVYGEPMYQEDHDQSLRFVLLKTIAGTKNRASVNKLLRRYFEQCEEDITVHVTMLVYRASVTTAERMAIAFIDGDVWESRNPERIQVGLI